MGIGTTLPRSVADFADAGAVGIITTNRFLIPPRITSTERAAIGTVQEGALIYNTTNDRLEVYAGSTPAWTEVGSGGGGSPSALNDFSDVNAGSPTDNQALVTDTATYTISATSAESENLSYQWQLNGSDATSGTVTRTTAANYYSTTNSVDFSHTIPSGATNVQIVVAGGSGGKGGAEDSNDPGGEGGAGFVGRFALPDGEQSIEVKIGRRGDDGVTGADTNGGIGGTSMCALSLIHI